jgi:hypothetical protein
MNIRKMQGTRVMSHEAGSGTEAKPQTRKMGPTLDQHAKAQAPAAAPDTGGMKKKATTRATTGGGGEERGEKKRDREYGKGE